METGYAAPQQQFTEKFKIDLIVWKPRQGNNPTSHQYWFKIDLIVWKLPQTILIRLTHTNV